MIAGDLWERQVTEFTWLVSPIGGRCDSDVVTGRRVERRKSSPARAVNLIDLQHMLRSSI